MKTIAFVGLGSMGRPMAANLARAQFSVRGFDVYAPAREAFLALAPQAEVCDSAAEAARGAEALVLMVVNAAQAEAALIEQGALAASARDALVILMSTCAPADARRLGALVEASGRRFLDCPVSGGVVGAEAGTLTLMAGGPAETVGAARPILDRLGDKLFHAGARAGDGAMMKTVNQLLCGVHIAVLAEAMALAEAAGLDKAQLMTMLGGSAASSWMLHNRGPRMLQDEPPVTSAVDIFVKDLGLVMQAGGAAHVALPVAAAAHQMFLAASGAGHGKADDSQVIRAYRALNGPRGQD